MEADEERNDTVNHPLFDTVGAWASAAEGFAAQG